MIRILVTGSESFIGKELITILKKRKFFVYGIDRYKKTSFTNKSIDINSKKINDIIYNYKIDTVIHLAAISRDADCKRNILLTFKSNVLGTLNLIDISKKNKIKNFIFASSEWVYDSFENKKEKKESDIIDIKKITSEYALSKLVSENNLRQFYEVNRKTNIIILRFGIIYGNRKNNWSAVESLFDKVKNKKIITVGSLKTARRFIHVKDICSGIISSINIKGFHIINLQGKKMVSLQEIIKKTSRLLNVKYIVNEENKNKPNIRKVSNNKSKKILKWEPKITIDDGLKMLNLYLKN
tara:strand:- start:20672 stop:21562 length:891 start_codon:yes stop_codon:yes gene_type:complete